MIALAIAGWMGFDFLPQQEEAPYGSIEPDGGPSILELSAAITTPLTWGGETLQASLQVMKLMQPEGSS